MSQEYKLLARLPFDDSETEAINRIATALDTPVVSGPNGSPRLETDGLLVYGVEPDEHDQAVVRSLFGVEISVTLVFVDSSHGDTEMMIRVVQNIMKVVLLFAALSDVEAVLVEDYSESSLILRIREGQLTLNQDWDGWQLWPEVLDTIPKPHQLESLRGR